MSWEIKLNRDMCPYIEEYSDGTLECYNPNNKQRTDKKDFNKLMLEGKKTGIICNKKNCPKKV